MTSTGAIWRGLHNGLEGSPQWAGEFPTMDWRVSKLTWKFFQIDLEPLSNQPSICMDPKKDSNPDDSPVSSFMSTF